MSGERRRREALVVVGAVFAVSLGGSFVVLGGGERPESATDKPERQPTSTLAGTSDLRVHGERSGSHLDGAVSTVNGDQIWLYLLPPKPQDPLVRFTIPPEVRRELDPAHLQNTSALRVYYRRADGRYVARGVAHPRSDGR